LIERRSTPKLRQRLADSRPLLAVELRPPRRDLDGVRAMEAWIDVYHAVRRLSAVDTLIFLTDNAIGTDEEESLSHLVRNLGDDVLHGRIAPFLTLKHDLQYCLRFADRAQRVGFPGLVVLGGDRHDGIPRCLPRSWQLRERLREESPGMLLGGWANPYHDPAEQAELLARYRGTLDFVLTQVTSHHEIGPVATFMSELARRGLDLPVFAGVFFFRSARRKTLDALAEFIPVPRAGIVRDFEERGLSPEEVAARTIVALSDVGVTRFYVSNLVTLQAARQLERIAELAGLRPVPRDPMS